MVVGQKTALGRTRKHQTVTVLVSETTLTVECGDGGTRVNHPAGAWHQGPAAAHRYLSFLDHMSHISCRRCVAHQSSDHKGGDESLTLLFLSNPQGKAGNKKSCHWGMFTYP